jgi:ABC-2 type transport system permease protein
VSEGRAGFREATYSEVTKFTTVRSTVILSLVLGLVLPLFSVIVAATESLQPDDTILGASVLGGAAIALVIAASLGTTVVTSEYRSGTILSTLTACPRRLVVLAAKSTVTAGTTFLVVLPSAALAFWIGALMLDSNTYETGSPFPGLIGVAAAVASIAAFGVGVGTIIRHSAGAVAVVVGVVLLPGLMAPLFGDLQRWVGGLSLTGVIQKLTQSSDATHEAVGSLGAWPSLLVVGAYTAATILAAVWLLRHRDINRAGPGS